MHGVEDPDRAVTPDETLVVEIVKVGLLVRTRNPWESEARVVCLRVETRVYDPHIQKQNVWRRKS